MEEFDSRYKRLRPDVPDMYFETLDDKVMSRIGSMKETDKSKKLSFSWGKPLTIAVSIALIAVISFLGYRSSETTEESISFSDLDSTDIANFVSQEEFSDEEFEEFVPEAVIDSLYQEKIIYQYANTYISEEEFEDLEEEYTVLEDETEI